jgi:hypothetical protein
MKLRKIPVMIAAGVAAIGIGSGAALAAWTVGGSGSGAGAATVANSLVVTPITPSGPAATLYPGGPAGPAYFTVANPNPFAVTITGLSWGTPVSTNTANCASANISLDPSAPTTVSIPIPANATAGTAYPINGVLDLAHSAPVGCEGVSFAIPVTITATQQ